MSRRKVYAVNINKTKLLMKSKGLTQVKLGELVGTSYQNIQKFKWNRNILLNVCAILCCEPEDILLQELGEDTEIYRFTLRELKERDREVYNKAIDDCIKEVEEEEKQHNHTITKDCLFWLKRKLEQLKAGGKNETN